MSLTNIFQLSDDIKMQFLETSARCQCLEFLPKMLRFWSNVSTNFSVSDILKLDNPQRFVSMLVDGVPVKPFNIRTPDLPAGNPDIVESLKRAFVLEIGRPRDEVEKEVMDKFMKI